MYSKAEGLRSFRSMSREYPCGWLEKKGKTERAHVCSDIWDKIDCVKSIMRQYIKVKDRNPSIKNQGVRSWLTKAFGMAAGSKTLQT